MAELEPCPFCGDDEIYTFHFKVGDVGEFRDNYGVGCNGCMIAIEAYIDQWKTEEDAIEAWNKRA